MQRRAVQVTPLAGSYLDLVEPQPRTVLHCCTPADGMRCEASVTNVGNVRLANISFGGDASNCTHALLAPRASFTCVLRKAFTPEQLANNGTVLLSYPVSVAPYGRVPLLDTLPPSTLSVDLGSIAASPACLACQGCMQATAAFVSAQAAETTPAARASAFGAYCSQSKALKQSALCAKVQADIAASALGNLGRRAGGLCMALGLCDRRLGATCTMQVAVNGSQAPVPTADLDACSGEKAVPGTVSQLCQ